MKTSAVIKSLAVALVLGGSSLVLGGCSNGVPDLLAPPAYSSAENSQRIWRYADYDRAQMIEDFDFNVTMTRPHSYGTVWNLAHHD